MKNSYYGSWLQTNVFISKVGDSHMEWSSFRMDQGVHSYQVRRMLVLNQLHNDQVTTSLSIPSHRRYSGHWIHRNTNELSISNTGNAPDGSTGLLLCCIYGSQPYWIDSLWDTVVVTAGNFIQDIHTKQAWYLALPSFSWGVEGLSRLSSTMTHFTTKHFNI